MAPTTAARIVARPLAAATVLALCYSLPACAPAPAGARVSGKVVHAGMGIEGAAISVGRWGGEAYEPFGEAASGYHGSFFLRLPPGRYRLEASAVLRRRGGGRLLQGALEGVLVHDWRRRVPDLILELEDAPPYPTSPLLS